MLRQAFITAALDAGVPLRDVQEAGSNADPRTTIRYDRARTSLDRHTIYIVAACHLHRPRTAVRRGLQMAQREHGCRAGLGVRRGWCVAAGSRLARR